MKANSSPMSVADYCQGIRAKKIIVNTEYQRNEGLWNNPARSFFVESILLEYPIPKIFLYARLDLKTRETTKEIVDGQQRSQALVAFFENRLALSKNIETEELRGLKYNQLSDDWKTKFLSYSLPIDQFSGVPEDEVREAFRRMNANNVPLNAEEQRNARYQGPFKWFIISIAKTYKEALLRIELFSRRDLIRMIDLRLYAEIVLTLDTGFQTVKGSQLDHLYSKYNVSFDGAEEFQRLIASGLDYVIETEALRQDVFLRMHVFQSLVLAIIAHKSGGDFVESARTSQPDLVRELNQTPFDIDALAASLREPDSFPQLSKFIQANTAATNTKESRVIRFLYFNSALNILT